MTPRKRAFETPDTAQYRSVVRPRLLLDEALGTPVDPRILAPPPSHVARPPAVMPTTSQTSKKSNCLVPYTRMCHDSTDLGAVGTPVFVRARGAPEEARGMNTLAGIDAVNRELRQLPQPQCTAAWRLDGILLSTEGEMDRAQQQQQLLLRARGDAGGGGGSGGGCSGGGSTAVLVALQGPTVLRNLYCSRPLVGDCVYLGLIDGDPTRWVPFCSQHLDMSHVPERPRAPQLGFAGFLKHRLANVTFDDAQIQRMGMAVAIGRITDCAPSPGMITVNVQLREMSWAELGRRHDETHAFQPQPNGGTVYAGRIGAASASRGGGEQVAQTVDSAVETVLRLSSGGGSSLAFDQAFPTVDLALRSHGNQLFDETLIERLRNSGNDFASADGTIATQAPTLSLPDSEVRHLAYAASAVASTLAAFLTDPLRTPTEREHEAYARFLVVVQAFWTRASLSHFAPTDLQTTIFWWTKSREPLSDDTLGALMRVSLLTDAVSELLHAL